MTEARKQNTEDRRQKIENRRLKVKIHLFLSVLCPLTSDL
jgi:hypothetical protein